MNDKKHFGDTELGELIGLAAGILAMAVLFICDRPIHSITETPKQNNLTVRDAVEIGFRAFFSHKTAEEARLAGHPQDNAAGLAYGIAEYGGTLEDAQRIAEATLAGDVGPVNRFYSMHSTPVQK